MDARETQWNRDVVSTEREPSKRDTSLSVYIFLADDPKSDFWGYLGPLLKCPLFKGLEGVYRVL